MRSGRTRAKYIRSIGTEKSTGAKSFSLVKIPHDRNGEYEPRIIEKYSRNADGADFRRL